MMLRRGLPAIPSPVLLLALLVPVAAAAPAAAADDQVAAFLPGDTVIYAELHQPVELADYWLSGGVQDLLSQTPQLRRFLRSREYAQLRAALAYVETRLGMSWKEALRRSTSGGVFLAIRANEGTDPAVAVVLRSDKPKTAEQVGELIRELASENGRVRRVTESGITVWVAGKAFAYFVHRGDLVLANNAELLRELVRRYAGQSPEGSLARDPLFRAARQQAANALARTDEAPAPGSKQVGWLFARTAPLRNVDGLRELYQAFRAEKFDDGGVPFLFGGLPKVLTEADYFTASLWQRSNGLSLIVELPRKSPEWPEHWQWAYAVERGKEAAVPLRPKGTLLSFSVYRDLKGFWDVKDRLVKRQGLTGFIELENELGRLLFPNRDFASEVLGQLDPRIRIVVVEQQYAAGERQPAIKLPAFAYVQRIKDPETFGEDLLIAYQTLIGLANLGLAQNNQPRLLVSTTEHRGVTLTVARFRKPVDGSAQELESFLYNFAPTFALCDDYAVIGSSEGVVQQIIDLLKDDPSATATTPHNVVLELYADPIARLLEQNIDALAHQQVVEEGIDPAEARARVELLIKAIRLFADARFLWGATADTMYLRIDINRK